MKSRQTQGCAPLNNAIFLFAVFCWYLLSSSLNDGIVTLKIIYSVHEHDFESPWLWGVNRGNSYIFIDYILVTFVDIN